MGRFENWTPATLGSELTSSEITTLEELNALANSSALQFVRKESGSFVNSTLSEIVSLSGLSDVSISSPTNGQVLTYNGSAWVNSSETGLGDALVANPLSQFAATTSAQLRGVISNETGTGVLVFSISPILETPNLGTPSVLVLTNATGLSLTTGVIGVLPIANGGTNASSASITAFNNITGYTASGATGTTSTNVVFSTSPTLVTPLLGTPTSGTLTNCTGLPLTGLTSDTTTALGIGSINLGHASDTTIVRVSAGVVSIEGVNIVTTSSTDTLTNKTLTSPTLTTPALGTPASGVLTNCTGLPAASVLAGSFGVGAYVISTSLQVATFELGHATDTTLSRVSAGLIAVEGITLVDVSTAQTLTNKTLTSPTLTTPSAFTTGGTITLAENTSIALDPAGSADGQYSGITVTAISGYAQAFGDLVYLDPTDSRWEAADADVSTAADGDPRGMLGMVVVTGTDGNACTILLQGIIRADAKFPALTINGAVYVGETAGAIQTAIPTGADNVIRVVGFALTADEIYFSPSSDHQISVA